MNTASAWVAPCLVFLLTLLSGVWLSSSGKPLNTAIMTVHKLIALAAVILTGMQVYGRLTSAPVPPIPGLLSAVGGLCVLALFATGALMSIGKFNYIVAVTIHRVLPVVAALSIATTIYLLASSRL